MSVLRDHEMGLDREGAPPRRDSALDLAQRLAVGCLFGSCAAMSVLAARGDIIFGRTTVAAVVLYAAVLYLPLISALAAVALTLLATVGIHDHDVALNLYRLTVAAGTFLAFRRRWSELSLLFVAVLSWQMMILLPPLFAHRGWTDPLPLRTVFSIPIELTAILMLCFFGCSRWMRRRFAPPFADFRSFLLHLFLIPLIAGACLALIITRSFGGIPMADLFVKLQLNSRHIVVGALGLLMALLLLSVLLSNIVVAVVDRYLRIFFSTSDDEVDDLVNVPFSDVAADLEVLAEMLAHFRSVDQLMAELATTVGATPEELMDRWRLLDGRSRLIERAALGCLLVSANGAVKYANRAAAALLDATSLLSDGASYRMLEQSEHPWGREVAQFLDETFRSSARWTWRCTAVDGRTLTVHIDPLKPERTSTASGKLAGGAMVFLVPAEDHSDFASRLQLPTDFEKFGSIGSELFERISGRTIELGETLMTAKQELGQKEGHVRQLNGQERAAIEILERATVAVNAIEQELEREQGRFRLNRRHCEQVDVGSLLCEAVRFVSQAQQQTAANPSLVIHGEPADCATVAIRAFAPRTEVWAFVRYAVLLLRQVLALVPDCRIELDYEQIGSNTASLLPGASAGRYIRFVLRHTKPFIASSVVAVQKETSLGMMRDAPESVELALQLVTQQVKRMCGFLSVQSSALKGTELSIYIPTDLTTMARLSKREQRRIERGRVQVEQHGETQVLVVSECDASAEILQRIAERLGCEVVVCDPTELMSQLVTPVDFSGLGFDQEEAPKRGSGRHAAVSAGSVDVQLFQLVLFSLHRATYEALALLESIQAEAPEQAKALFVEESDLPKVQLLRAWEIMAKPIDEDQVIEYIAGYVGRQAKVREQVAAPEDEDTFGGTGF